MTPHPVELTPLEPLKPGARVALVATSGPVVPELIDRATALLRAWDLDVVEGKHLRDVHPHASYLAGHDVDRAADLTDAWCDPSIDAVLCARGGYGAVRLLDLLDADRLRAARPKLLLGSSDVTALHEYWHEVLETPTWFTPMVGTLALLDDREATASLREALFAPWEGRTYQRRGARALVPGSAEGVLVGGNLSLLAMTLAATHRPPRPRGPRLALLEDVDEKPYRIDGFLTSLLRSGWFDGVTGIVLGSWQDCGDPAEVEAVCTERLAPLGVPTVWELGFGHGPAAPSVPLGIPARLDAAGSTLTLSRPTTIHEHPSDQEQR